MSSNEVVIDVNNISKCFEIYNKPSDRLKQFVSSGMGLDKKYYKEYWALNNVSFQVQRGETVGILGGNGAGKSTLLQIICNTLTPTSGNITVQGRIAALLELGSGFNPEFTGIENIYMSCALLGLSKNEVDDKLDKILSFADIGDFVNQPVKTYSSGMFVRLAFAVNVQSSPEIMIVDEALAVGDMNFQAKCMTALKRIKDDGASILFVSHDTSSVKSLCERAVFLEKGQLVEKGKAEDIAEKYIKRMRLLANEIDLCDEIGAIETRTCVGKSIVDDEVTSAFKAKVVGFRYGSGTAEVTNARILLDGLETNVIPSGAEVQIELIVDIKSDCKISVNFNVLDDKKIEITGGNFSVNAVEDIDGLAGQKYKVTYCAKLPLMSGNYGIRTQIISRRETNVPEFVDVIPDAIIFKVEQQSKNKIWWKVAVEQSLMIDKLQ